ncbi:NADH-quinone oxidoreductase subunit J, partial [Streptomyces sp. ventii]|nr:NADH-quinone oxidoreductase subunit J [Streptomyces spiramenti]
MSAAGHGDGNGWEPTAGTPGSDDYAAAIGALHDPLNDPLPGSYDPGTGAGGGSAGAPAAETQHGPLGGAPQG